MCYALGFNDVHADNLCADNGCSDGMNSDDVHTHRTATSYPNIREPI